MGHTCVQGLPFKRDLPPTPPLVPRWWITTAGWVVDDSAPLNGNRQIIAQILGHGDETNPSRRIAAARVAALIVNAPEAVEVIRGMMTVNLRDSAALRVAMDRARQWLALALETEEDIP